MNISERYGVNLRKGARFGVEVELEADHLPEPPAGWRMEHDGSLRGNAAEYVFRDPSTQGNAMERIDRLKKATENCGIRDTGRAGIHVHVNISDMSEQEVYNFIFLYLIFEDALMEFCGEGRSGNLFCLRARDAEDILFGILDAIELNDLRRLNSDDYRYASINCKAIVQYGSLEFRGMRSDGDFERIKVWVNILNNLREASQTFEKATDIVTSFSVKSPMNMAEDIFGRDLLRSVLCDDFEQKAREGMRRIQHLTYRRDAAQRAAGKQKAKKGVGAKLGVPVGVNMGWDNVAQEIKNPNFDNGRGINQDELFIGDDPAAAKPIMPDRERRFKEQRLRDLEQQINRLGAVILGAEDQQRMRAALHERNRLKEQLGE